MTSLDEGGVPALAAAAAAAANGAGFAPRFGSGPLLSDAACGLLDDTTELDYLTQARLGRN